MEQRRWSGPDFEVTVDYEPNCHGFPRAVRVVIETQSTRGITGTELQKIPMGRIDASARDIIRFSQKARMRPSVYP